MAITVRMAIIIEIINQLPVNLTIIPVATQRHNISIRVRANRFFTEASMQYPTQAYGLWSLVVINSIIFIFFAFTFFKPQTSRDWRTLGAYSAFIVALFSEMYGFPLTIYLLSGWLQEKWPDVNWMTHDSGHLLETMLGWKTNPHFGPWHLLSFVFIGSGFWLLAVAWTQLYHAQRHHRLATHGIYSYIRHPQYVGFIAIMLGFLLQWPTILTLLMFPVLVVMYIRLAKTEEQSALREYGEKYLSYMSSVPGFIPRLEKIREIL
jgi:protein-S-isoprenylcysteine O-methyltransferase Ste14